MIRAVALILALVELACSRDVELVTAGDGGESLCQGGGEPTRFAGGGGECAGAIAARHHRHALCTCSTLALAGLATDSFDSTGLTPPGRTAAAVGVGETFSATGTIDVGGALHVPELDSSFAAQVRVAESLRASSSFRLSAGDATVSGDAFIDGDVGGAIAIAGALHVPPSAIVGPGVTAASVVREELGLDEPCDCDAARAVDVDAEVAAVAVSNDNRRIGLDADALMDDQMRAVDLPCGKFYLTGIDRDLELELRVHGRVVVAVTADVVLRAPLRVTLDPGAELDMLIGGTLIVVGAHVVGNSQAPARTRLWIAGGVSVTLAAGMTLGAILSAPNARLTAQGVVTVHGSMLVDRFEGLAMATWHYDRAILSAGVVCGVAATTAVR